MLPRIMALAMLASLLPARGQTATDLMVAKAAQESEIDDLIRKGDAHLTAGDKTKAIQVMEEAWQKVQKNPAMKPKEPEVLARLAAAYVQAQRPADGVRAYQFLLQDIAADCLPASANLDRCADARYGLA